MPRAWRVPPATRPAMSRNRGRASGLDPQGGGDGDGQLARAFLHGDLPAGRPVPTRPYAGVGLAPPAALRPRRARSGAWGAPGHFSGPFIAKPGQIQEDLVMERCPCYGGCRHYELADGRRKCPRGGRRFSWTSVWHSVRLPSSTTMRLLESFVLGVPSYRQRFRDGASAQARDRFYRLLRACCARVEQLREPFEGAVECDETTIGDARKGKRDRNAAGKMIVFGLIKRNGRVKAAGKGYSAPGRSPRSFPAGWAHSPFAHAGHSTKPQRE